MKHCLLFICSFSFFIIASNGAVPLRWTVETSRVQIARFDAYHGETLDLAATLQADGMPLAITNDVSIYWQTNGMGSAYWTAPAALSNNVMRARWTPSMDVGANAYSCFIGAAGEIYRAAFQLRLRDSPGAEPNTLPIPQPVIDFNRVTVLNPPWPTNAVQAVNGQTGEVQLDAANLGAYTTGEVDAALDLKRNKTDRKVYFEYWWPCHEDGTKWGQPSALSQTFKFGVPSGDRIHFEYSIDGVKQGSIGLWTKDGSPYIVPRLDPPFGWWSENTRISKFIGTDETDTLALTSDVQTAIEDSGHATATDLAPIRTKVEQSLIYSSGVYQYMTANTNAWFSSTNYLVSAADRSARTRWAWKPDMDPASVPPSMALLERRDGEVQYVWDQRDWPKWYYDYREGKLKAEIAQTNAALRAELHRLDTNKMSRGWSHYTAVNGLDNPYRDTTWIDTPKIILAAGYQWETSVELSGIWVLAGNGIQIASPTTEDEAEGSTYFTIKDFEGNAVLTVRKSDTRILGAIPSSISVNGSESFTVAYAVNAQPVGEFTTDLANDFVAEGDARCPFNVAWSHSGTNYVATVTAKSGTLPGAAFMRAKYEVPGETIIDNSAPIKFSNYLQFGNLKIRPVKSGGTITWEEVQ